MLSLLFWLTILSSGSILSAAVWNKKYEEILPITNSLIVVVLYIFGLAGKLLLGSKLIILAGIIVYIVAIIVLVKRKNLQQFLRNVITPASVAFALFVGIICFGNYGRRAYGWDELSHWMDIVKVVATLDAFGTHPEANAIFPSYPPGMVLFQYLYQKINLFLGGSIFSEWRAYVAYQLFFASYCIPFFSKYDFKDVIKNLSTILLVLLSPIFFFPNLYSSLYIDPILGILMGTGVGRVYIEKERDVFYRLHIIMTCIMLVLMKDAGLLFSLFLAGFYLINEYMEMNRSLSINTFKNFICKFLFLIIPIMGTKVLWDKHLEYTSSIRLFSAPYNIETIWNVIRGEDHSYKRDTWLIFWDAFIHRKNEYTNWGIGISYCLLFFILMGVIALLVFFENKRRTKTARSVALILFECGFIVVYIVGICITYIEKFTQFEALKLASFERYMNIGYLSIGMVVVLLVVEFINQRQRSKMILPIVALGLLLGILPLNVIKDFITREGVEDSISAYEPYEELIDKVKGFCNEEDRIYFITQENNGYDRLLLCYAVRPVKANQYVSGSIGEPFYEGDVYTRDISVSEWQNELMADYDYVGIYKSNDYFGDVYGVLFENPEEIANNELYSVNKETGLLELCE